MTARPKRPPVTLTGGARREPEADPLTAGGRAPAKTTRRTAAKTPATGPAKAAAKRAGKTRTKPAAAAAAPTAEPVREAADTSAQPGGKPATVKRESHSTYWTPEGWQRVRAAVGWLSFYRQEAGIRNLHDVVERGVQKYLDELADEYNDGKPWPTTSGGLTVGRPPR